MVTLRVGAELGIRRLDEALSQDHSLMRTDCLKTLSAKESFLLRKLKSIRLSPIAVFMATSPHLQDFVIPALWIGGESLYLRKAVFQMLDGLLELPSIFLKNGL